MGARQSKRSVDITTTPKKGEGEVIAEGEGKLEKIGDADIKATTNGAVPHIEIEEKDENEKDAAAEKDTKEEVKENGLSESEDAKTPDAEQSEENVTEKTPESGNETKIEDTPETKKQKEKNKKKKWSFRSISFSKKDKQKPSKDSDKNGDVKEVAEENPEEIATSPSVESPKSEEPKSAEAVTNGNASAEEIAKPVEAKILPEESAKAPEEPKPDEPKPAPVEEPKPAVVEEPKVPEPVVEKSVESAPSPAKEQEEPQPVEPPTPEETKEVRNEEVPPPLPSSNPPSSVTVFAESTKADALAADQVPVLEPSIAESPPRAASSPIAKAVSEPLPVVETLEESLPEKVPETLLVHSDTTVPKDIGTRETEQEPVTVPSPVQVLEETVEETLPKTPEKKEIRPELPLEEKSELPGETITSLVEQKPDEETPKSPITSKTILPEEQTTKEYTSEAALDSPIKDHANTPESSEICTNISQSSKTVTDEPATVIPEVVSESQEMPTESEPEELKPHKSNPASVETIPSPQPLEDTPKESLESVEAKSEIISEPSSIALEQPESLPDLPKSPDLSSESLPSLPEPVSELEPMSLPPVESVPDPIATDCASELSLPDPIVTDCTSELPPPEAVATDCAGASELSPPEAVATDCAPELSPPEAVATDRASELPLPEAVATDRASELSPPEAVAIDRASELSPPEAVATDCARASELSPPSDSPVLTNGSTNGLPSPKEVAVTARKSIEGPIKQVLAEPTNEVRQEEGEKKDSPVEAAAVEE
ncbi:unnamed protein product [Phaedon cochleariae]|uniref:Uncharacterized protein n=1 Tax=Phaedon cochleariae TaxID=80249 RepID=A0A9P0GR99_PHACE|nr:unnamed protein product [Phaedon cochleariae]